MKRDNGFILLLFLYLVIGVAGIVVFFNVPYFRYQPAYGASPAPVAGNATISAPTRAQDESSEETLPTLPELPETSAGETGTETAETPAPEPAYTYTAIHQSKKLYIRDDASLDANIISYLKQGESGDVIRIEGDWVLLRHGDLEGYVYKKYLNLEIAP